MAKVDVVRALVEPIVAERDADLYDVQLNAGTLVVSVTRRDGIDLDTITDISRAISRTLDDEDPINGSYTLEVSSPGLERTLRTPAHFAGAIGSEVTIRTKPGVEGERRVKGVLSAADDQTATIALDDDAGTRVLDLADIERARTVFSWEPTPKRSSKQHSNRPHKEARS